MRCLILPLLLAAPTAAHADPATVEAVDLRTSGETWTISVTIRHGDTGWDDYADGWRVETTAGETLGTRVLHHPHVEEQPFTRSLSGVELPPGTDAIAIRTRTSITGWGEAAEGPFTVPPRD